MYTLTGHNLRFFTLTPTLSQWEMELKEIAVYNRSKYNSLYGFAPPFSVFSPQVVTLLLSLPFLPPRPG
jgi:hypothetical protein